MIYYIINLAILHRLTKLNSSFLDILFFGHFFFHFIHDRNLEIYQASLVKLSCIYWFSKTIRIYSTFSFPNSSEHNHDTIIYIFFPIQSKTIAITMSTSELNEHRTKPQWSQDLSSEFQTSYIGCYAFKLGSSQNEQGSRTSYHVDLPNPMRDSQACADLCGVSGEVQVFPFYGLQLGRCSCFDVIPDASSRVDDALCIHQPRTTALYWALHSRKRSRLPTIRGRPMHNVRGGFLRRERISKSLLAERGSEEDESEEPANQEDRRTTENLSSVYEGPASIFVTPTLSQSSSNNSMPIVAIVIACLTLILGVSCFVITLNRRMEQDRLIQEGVATILPSTPSSSREDPNQTRSTRKIIEIATRQVNHENQPAVVEPYVPEKRYLDVVRPEVAQSSRREQVVENQFVKPPYHSTNRSKSLRGVDQARVRDRVPIRGSMRYPVHPERSLPAIWEHCQNHEQRRIVPGKASDHALISDSRNVEDLNSLNANGACSVVIKPENLARECYPHSKLVSSSSKLSPIASTSRNSWILKCPPSLRPSVSQLNPSSCSNKPLPVRKLKASFGVGRETNGLAKTEEELSKVDGSERDDDRFLGDGCTLTPIKSVGSDRCERQSSIPRLTIEEHSGTSVENKINRSPSERLDKNETTKRTSQRIPSDNSSPSEVSSRDAISAMNSLSSDHGRAQYLSLSGFSKVPDFATASGSKSTVHFPEKPVPRIKSFTTLGNKLSNLAYPSPSTPKGKNLSPKDSFPGIMKRASFHPSLNWGRRKKNIGGSWKRVNSVSSHTRSRFTNSFSISSDAVNCVENNRPELGNTDNLQFLPAPWASSLTIEKVRMNRHKHSRSVPDDLFMSPLNLDAEAEFEPRSKLSVMNPDRDSLVSETANRPMVHESEEDETVNQCVSRFSTDTRIAARDEDLNAENDNASIGSSSNSSACKTPTMDKSCRALFFRSVNPLLEILNSNHEGSTRPEELLERSHSRSRHTVLSQTSPSVRVSDPLPSSSSWHPIYNLPMSPPISPQSLIQNNSIEDHQSSLDSSLNETHAPGVESQATTSQNACASTSSTNESKTSKSSYSTPATPPIFVSPAQVQQEGPSKSSGQSYSSELGIRGSSGLRFRKDRYGSGGDISGASSDDHSSFGTGAASVNSEPMWISRLNSAGSFATNQSLDEHRLWVANPDGTYSPSLESVFNHSSRLVVSPGITSASGSSVVC